MERVGFPPEQDAERRIGLQDIHWMVATLSTVLSPPLTASQVQQLSPTALAYLGDAVYELYIRTCYLLPPQRIQSYHRQVVDQVNAAQQALHLEKLLPHLTDFEQDLLRRGRNATPRRSRRINPETYQQATSLETLIGYLYLTDPQRLLKLLGHLRLETATSRAEDEHA